MGTTIPGARSRYGSGYPARVSWRVSGRRRADLAAVLLALALALFGARYHWVEESGGEERDGFVAQAEALLGGEIPYDPYRPLLYPLLVAALASLGIAPFTAARLLSNLAAALLARSAYALGARLDPAEPPGDGGSATGAWAMALTAVNPNLWILGQHASTDMSFAAVAAWLLVALVDHARAPGRRSALALGGLYGTAAFLRVNAAFLLPGLLLGFVLAGAPWRRRAAELGLAASLAVLVLAPHFWLRSTRFGDALHDENWKNLAWKLYGEGDWSYFERVPFDSLSAVVAHDPAQLIRSGFAELLRFADSGPGQILGSALYATLVLAGLAALLVVARSRAAGLLAASVAAFLLALALLFFTWGRFLLFAIPVGAAFAAAGVAVVRSRFGAGRSAGRLASAVLAAAVALLSVKTALVKVPAFVRRHPVAEIAALRGVAAATPGTALAGTAPFLGRYLPGPYLDIPDAFGRERAEPGRYFERIERLLRERGVRFLVVSELELAARPRALLGPRSPAPWLRLVRTFAGGALWEVVGEGGEAVVDVDEAGGER